MPGEGIWQPGMDQETRPEYLPDNDEEKEVKEYLKKYLIDLLMEDIRKRGPIFTTLRKELGLTLNRRIGYPN